MPLILENCFQAVCSYNLMHLFVYQFILFIFGRERYKFVWVGPRCIGLCCNRLSDSHYCLIFSLLLIDVPEGSMIIRAHTPMSNLFSCLWFNEVDRFTPRDQLSFAYTYQKVKKKNPSKTFYLHMFKVRNRFMKGLKAVTKFKRQLVH